MEHYIFTVGEEKGTRIDKFIATQFDDYSRSFVQQIIDSGNVLVNEKPIKKNYKLKAGDQVDISIPEPEMLNVEAEDIPINIIYEDDEMLIIDKTDNMVVHPAPGNYTGTLVNALMFHVEKLSSINGVIRPGIVHRIDKDTSGLLVIAKTDRAHQFLSDQLRTHDIERTYYALVHGNVSKPGTIDKPIARNPKNRLKMAIVMGGREAITHYEPIRHYGKLYTLLRVELETGRTHQIRIHLQSSGHPILGDPMYGVKKEKVKHHRQMLHAKELRLVHPVTNELMHFESDLPEDFQSVLNKLEKMYGGSDGI